MGRRASGGSRTAAELAPGSARWELEVCVNRSRRRGWFCRRRARPPRWRWAGAKKTLRRTLTRQPPVGARGHPHVGRRYPCSVGSRTIRSPLATALWPPPQGESGWRR
jgi:hypothetical protein